MSEQNFSCLENSVWSSLIDSHKHLGIINGGASRYFPEISPFAALKENTPSSLKDLAEIVSAGESVLVRGDITELTTQWVLEKHILSLQYILPSDVHVDLNKNLIPLTHEHIPAMLQLAELVLPGFLQKRSLEMGSYFGIFDENKLVAMAGERIFPKPFKEITAVCTHPDYQGCGYASKLVKSVAALMRTEGNIPFLHVGAKNTRAKNLYLHLGFQERIETQIFRIRRV